MNWLVRLDNRADNRADKENDVNEKKLCLLKLKRKKNLIFSKKGGMTSFTKVNCLSDHEIANRHT